MQKGQDDSQLPEVAPLTWVEDGGYYAVSRHADITRICMEPEVFSSNLVALVLQGAQSGAQIIEVPEGVPKPVDVLAIADPPDHTRQRKLLNADFNATHLSHWEERIRNIAGSLMASAIAHNPVQWMEHFAIPLPLAVISEMMGLPAEDCPRLRRWSDAGVSVVSGTARGEELSEIVTALVEFQSYLATHLQSARENPGNNLLGKLATSCLSEDATDISDDEAISILLQLVIAGSESTASLIGSAAQTLAQHPALAQQLRDNPERIEPFVEEVVRLEPPFTGHFRVVRQPTEIAGVELPVGTRLMLDWAHANRDADAITCPHALDLDRPRVRNHLAFGHGIHRCIGAALARLEARIAVETLLQSTCEIQIETDFEIEHIPSIFTRRLAALHLRLTPAEPATGLTK